MTNLSTQIAKLMASLDARQHPCPANAICSHHGVHTLAYVRGEAVRVGITVASERPAQVRYNGTLLTIYPAEYASPNPLRGGKKTQRLVTKTVEGLPWGIADRWNTDTCGGSYLLDLDCAPALVASIKNYRAIGIRCFNPTKKDKQGFQAWWNWYAKRRVAVGLKGEE